MIYVAVLALVIALLALGGLIWHAGTPVMAQAQPGDGVSHKSGWWSRVPPPAATPAVVTP